MARPKIPARKPTPAYGTPRTADPNYSGSLSPYVKHYPDAMTDPKGQRVRETVDAMNRGITERATKRRFLKQRNTI